jgi:hypothetical protein
MVIEWTARRSAPDDTIEVIVRDTRRFLNGAPDDGETAGRLAVERELERLERQIARGAPADGLRLAHALVAWVSRTDAAAWSAATQH